MYANETIKILMERSSCRNFLDKEISDDIMNGILEAGIQAASGGNLQPFSIIKIKDKKQSEILAKLCSNQKFIAQAPTNLLFCIDLRRLERWAELEKAPFKAMNSFRHFWISFQDTVIAAQNICTAADSYGLGSVYVGSVLECFSELRDMFKLPKGVIPVVLLSLGYPKFEATAKRKLSLKAIVHEGCYRELSDTELLEEFNNKYIGWKMKLKNQDEKLQQNYHDIEKQELLNNKNTLEKWQLDITDERLQELYEVCLEVSGEEFAKECVEKIKEQGYINHAQYRFGLHYKANLMIKDNDKFVETMKEFGLNIFE